MNLIDKAINVLKDPNASADAKELAEAIVREMSGQQRQSQMMRDLQRGPSMPQPKQSYPPTQSPPFPQMVRFGEPDDYDSFFRQPFRG